MTARKPNPMSPHERAKLAGRATAAIPGALSRAGRRSYEVRQELYGDDQLARARAIRAGATIPTLAPSMEHKRRNKKTAVAAAVSQVPGGNE